MGYYPDNSDHAGFYNPADIPIVPASDNNEWLNRTKGILDAQTLAAISKIIDQAPGLHAQNLQLAGEDVIWLPRLTSGQLCSNFEENQQQCGQSKCDICFNTNYVGGFGTPRKIKMSFQPMRDDIVETQDGFQQVQNPVGWTIPTLPIVKEFDLIVTYSNERFLVSSCELQEKRGRKVYQNINMTRADGGSVWYTVPIPGFYASNFMDFACDITIRGPFMDFPCTITIKNPYWDSWVDVNN